jgi:hypothetical protein
MRKREVTNVGGYKGRMFLTLRCMGTNDCTHPVLPIKEDTTSSYFRFFFKAGESAT